VIAKRYQQILARLSTEGLVNLNKSLPAPFDIENVLVIAPENAAGLGDFRKDADASIKLVFATLFIIQLLFRVILLQIVLWNP
jgi:exonuclease VII large subunit